MDPSALTACMIALCAPVAALCTMLSVSYGQDSELSVSLVSMSTLLSIATMPPIIVLVGGNGHDGRSGRNKGSGREDIAGAYMPPVWRTAVSIPVLPVNGSL